jgi:hypothetical protein
MRARTSRANRSPMTPAGRDRDVDSASVVHGTLERRTRVRLRNGRGSGARRAAGTMTDQRNVDRVRALLGCATHGIRPPGT